MSIKANEDFVSLGVIIPVYNGAKYLKESVYSVLCQPCRDLALIIINDGSTDNSLEIAKQIAMQDERVHVIDQSNAGVSVARNKGIEYCIEQNIRYIAFLDADDVWATKFYTDELNEQLQDGDVSLFRFSYYEANEQLTRGRGSFVEDGRYENDSIRVYGGYIWCSIYNTELFRKHSLRFPVGIKSQEDIAFYYLFLRFSSKVIYNRKVMMLYRSNSGSTLHQKRDVIETYLGSCIAAWSWVQSELEARLDDIGKTVYEKSAYDCKSMQKTYISEMIQTASENGVKFNRLKEAISKSDSAKLYNCPSLWVDERSLKRWKRFHRAPRIVYFAYGIRGALVFIGRKTLRNSWFVQKIRYPEPLADVYSANAISR